MNFYEFYRLINEYGQTLIQTLIKKFQEEEPSLTQDIIRRYIDRFERIKNNLPEKDITKYSWVDLESAVDSYQSKERIKAGRLDSIVTDANLLFQKDGIRIYLGKDKKSCIKYGNGYTFCISARGENNMYDHYRLNKNGTPYFIFNDNLQKENPDHILVLFVYNYQGMMIPKQEYGMRYSVTNALNQREKSYKKLRDVISDYPWLNYLEKFIDDEQKGVVSAPPLEYLEYYLKQCSKNTEIDLSAGVERVDALGLTPSPRPIFIRLIKDSNKQEIQEFINDNIRVAFVRMYPILLEEIIPIKDLKATKLPYQDVRGELIDVDNFLGLDFPKYFAFFTKNSGDTLRSIRQIVKGFLEEYQLEKDADEVFSILNQKEQVFQRLLENNKLNKNLKYSARSVDNLTSFSQLFKSKGDTTIIPYLVVQVNNARENLTKLVDDNAEEINKFYNLKNRYNKYLDYVRTLKTEQQQIILDVCHVESIDGKHIGRLYSLDNLCFIFNIIEYFMKNNFPVDVGNSTQINNIAKNIYYQD